MSALGQKRTSRLVDHLVGTTKQGERCVKSESLRGLEIDNHFKLRGLDVLDAAVIGEGRPGEAQTMTARRVSQPFALFCAAGARPPRTEAGMTSSV
jgi:hypothetical protein